MKFLGTEGMGKDVFAVFQFDNGSKTFVNINLVPIFNVGDPDIPTNGMKNTVPTQQPQHQGQPTRKQRRSKQRKNTRRITRRNRSQNYMNQHGI